MLRLQHVAVTFPPGRADAIRGFYAGVLGISEMPVPPEVAHLGWVWFSTADAGVELHFIPHAIEPDPQRTHHFCLQVDDLADVRGRLEAAGSEVRDAGSRIEGRDRAFVRDPVGNLVELVEMTEAGASAQRTITRAVARPP
jgi:catechol 2,3-dioxygenase-like lactoylglutathione lyase family enzyme